MFIFRFIVTRFKCSVSVVTVKNGKGKLMKGLPCQYGIHVIANLIYRGKLLWISTNYVFEIKYCHETRLQENAEYSSIICNYHREILSWQFHRGSQSPFKKTAEIYLYLHTSIITTHRGHKYYCEDCDGLYISKRVHYPFILCFPSINKQRWYCWGTFE